MPQQRKKKERSERLRGERDQIKFIDLGFERWQVQYVAIYGTSFFLSASYNLLSFRSKTNKLGLISLSS